MCSKYKKRNFMVPVKTGIPPNNSFQFFFSRWNIYETSAMEGQEKNYQIWYTELTLRWVNFRENWREIKNLNSENFHSAYLLTAFMDRFRSFAKYTYIKYTLRNFREFFFQIFFINFPRRNFRESGV